MWTLRMTRKTLSMVRVLMIRQVMDRPRRRRKRIRKRRIRLLEKATISVKVMEMRTRMQPQTQL